MIHNIEKPRMSASCEGSGKIPLVSVIVLTYNGKKDVEACLASLKKQTFPDYEIIVVDNVSTDGTPDMIRELKDSLLVNNLTIVQNMENTGYCGGNNLGAEYCRGKYIVILNQDTWVDSGWLEALVRDAEAHDDVAILQSKILYPDGKIRTMGDYMDRYGMFLCRGRFEEDRGQYDGEPYDFFFACGASVMMKKVIFIELGKFDEVLFMYADDQDICWKARLKGYKIKITPDSICYHKGGEAFATGPGKFYFICRNRLRVLLKNYSAANVVIRIPIAVFLIVLSALFFSFWRRNIGFLYQTTRALFWNLKNLGKTLDARSIIQSQRCVKDKEIDKYLYPFSFEINHYFFDVLRKIRGGNS